MGRFFVFAVLISLCTWPASAADDLGGIRIAGLATATVDRSGRIVSAARGCAVFEADGRTCARAMTPETPMRVASISKLVTAVGVMRMVEARQLDLDRDVSSYLGYPVRNPAFPNAPVTLRQMLSHTSTLTDGPGYVFGLGERVAPSIVEPGRWDEAHAPGTFYRYSNYNFVLIGTIMEAVSGERFDRLMSRLVLRPLAIEGCFNWAACSDDTLAKAATLYRTGEDETKFDPAGAWVPQVDDLKGKRPACPVYRTDASLPCDLTAVGPGVNGGLFSPQGGLRISVRGLAIIARMLVTEGRGPGGRFLRRSSVRAMFKPQWALSLPAAGETERGTMCAYGLSIHLLAARHASDCRDDLFGDGRRRGGHIGEAYGLYGGVWIDPAGRRASIYLVSGTAVNPAASSGAHSAFSRLEEAAADLTR